MFWEAVRDVKEDHNFNYTRRSSMSDVDHEKKTTSLVCLLTMMNVQIYLRAEKTSQTLILNGACNIQV